MYSAMRFADEPFGALVFRCRERRDHLHDLVHDHRGRCRLVLAERRFGGAMDRGDPFRATLIAERVQAFRRCQPTESRVQSLHSDRRTRSQRDLRMTAVCAKRPSTVSSVRGASGQLRGYRKERLFLAIIRKFCYSLLSDPQWITRRRRRPLLNWRKSEGCDLPA